mmetsp:Transcript_63533/g.206435  ORF Transcript_63533/g.206435 Transcript_63533/m.206435 type:complete len:208 (+) Transcript_63533:965-1588(+)
MSVSSRALRIGSRKCSFSRRPEDSCSRGLRSRWRFGSSASPTRARASASCGRCTTSGRTGSASTCRSPSPWSSGPRPSSDPGTPAPPTPPLRRGRRRRRLGCSASVAAARSCWGWARCSGAPTTLCHRRSLACSASAFGGASPCRHRLRAGPIGTCQLRKPRLHSVRILICLTCSALARRGPQLVVCAVASTAAAWLTCRSTPALAS